MKNDPQSIVSKELSPADGTLWNLSVQVAALGLNKLADGVAGAKLILPWLAQSLGVPGAVIGLFVPIREAGALLPQLALARHVAHSPRRARMWSLGAAIQGMAALGIAASALFLNGFLAGLGMVICLVALSLARALCSVSHKDTLARSLPKGRRGRATGLAGSLGAIGVLAFGAALSTGLLPLTPPVIAASVAAAGICWLLAAALFLSLRESVPDDATTSEEIPNLLSPLRRDPQLRLFLVTRALLTATALAPPFLLMLAGTGSAGLGTLGPMVLASSVAGILSAWLWGHLSDRSSRRTLILSGAGSAVLLALTAAIGITTGGLFGTLGGAVMLFGLQVAYEGVRAGRKLHLTDMARDSDRAVYTAVSNSLIGIVLVLGGGLGLVADLLGPAITLGLLALPCAAAAWAARGLDEVQSAR